MIEFDNSYEFVFLEEKNKNIKHPISGYYMILNDLSINILISLKWCIWGYVFFNSLKTELNEISREYKLDEMFKNAIQKIEEIEEKERILILDGNIISKKEDFNELIDNFYNKSIFNENTKVHFKLKLNLKDYLLLTNYLYPELIVFK